MLGRDAQLFCNEFPGKCDRFALKVVAKRKIAEHLEERIVPVRMTDLLEIIVLAAGTHTLLTCSRPSLATRRFLVPQKHAFELHHPRVRK